MFYLVENRVSTYIFFVILHGRFVSSLSFMQLLIYICVDPWMFILYFGLQSSTTLLLILFQLQISKLGVFKSDLMSLLHITIIVTFWFGLGFFFLRLFFTFWQYKMLQTHLVPVLESSIHFSSSLSLFYWKPDLGTRCAFFSSFFIF